jgi:hypothetical protein
VRENAARDNREHIARMREDENARELCERTLRENDNVREHCENASGRQCERTLRECDISKM